MSINLAFSGTILGTDSTTNNLTLQKILSGFAFTTGTVVAQGEGSVVGTSPVSLTMPNGAAQVVYIANTHATQTIAINWTPNGGSTAVGPVLQPGACVILIEPNATSGFTAISVTGSGAGTSYEYILVG